MSEGTPRMRMFAGPNGSGESELKSVVPRVRYDGGTSHRVDAAGIREGRMPNTYVAATPAGVVSVSSLFRGCRSFLAQPTANRSYPSGMTGAGCPLRSGMTGAGTSQCSIFTIPEPGGVTTICGMTEPGGFKAISRWLRSAATTPPESDPNEYCIPEGCQP